MRNTTLLSLRIPLQMMKAAVMRTVGKRERREREPQQWPKRANFVEKNISNVMVFYLDVPDVTRRTLSVAISQQSCPKNVVQSKEKRKS